MPHVHIGAQEIAVWTFTMIIVGFLWRSVSAKLADSAVGKAMAYIY